MGELSSNTRLVPGAHVHVREFDGELVVLNLKSGLYFALRDVGSLAWQRVVAGQTFGEVAQEIANEYDVAPNVALNDLFALGNEWLDRGLMELRS